MRGPGLAEVSRKSPIEPHVTTAHHNSSRQGPRLPHHPLMKLLTVFVMLVCGLRAEDPFRVKVTGHGRPMILIPGLSSSGETWDTTSARYKDRFECHVLTVAGFGGVARVAAPMWEHVGEGHA